MKDTEKESQKFWLFQPYFRPTLFIAIVFTIFGVCTLLVALKGGF